MRAMGVMCTALVHSPFKVTMHAYFVSGHADSSSLKGDCRTFLQRLLPRLFERAGRLCFFTNAPKTGWRPVMFCSLCRLRCVSTHACVCVRANLAVGMRCMGCVRACHLHAANGWDRLLSSQNADSVDRSMSNLREPRNSYDNPFLSTFGEHVRLAHGLRTRAARVRTQWVVYRSQVPSPVHFKA